MLELPLFPPQAHSIKHNAEATQANGERLCLLARWKLLDILVPIRTTASTSTQCAVSYLAWPVAGNPYKVPGRNPLPSLKDL